MSDGIGSGFGFGGLLGLDPQALSQTPMSPQGIPTGLDQAASTAGLPPLSSIVQGMQGDPSATPGIGSRIGSLLSQIAQGSGNSVQQLQNGQMSPMQFLQSAANQARMVMGGPGAPVGQNGQALAPGSGLGTDGLFKGLVGGMQSAMGGGGGGGGAAGGGGGGGGGGGAAPQAAPMRRPAPQIQGLLGAQPPRSFVR